MALSLAVDVLVVSVDQTVGGSLNRLANRNNWPILKSESVRQAMLQVLNCNPRVVIVQVSEMTDRAIQFIRALQSGWRKVTLIAVAGEHNDDLEMAVRSAGATCYLPDADSVDAVSQTVEQILEPSRPSVSRITTPAPAFAGRNTRWSQF